MMFGTIGICLLCVFWGVAIVRMAPNWIQGNKARINLFRGYCEAIARKDWTSLQSMFDSMTSEELERFVSRIEQLGPIQEYGSMGFRSMLQGDRQVHRMTYRIVYAHGSALEYFVIETKGTEKRIMEYRVNGKVVFESPTLRSRSVLGKALWHGITIGSTD